jgi:hypothetical protein
MTSEHTRTTIAATDYLLHAVINKKKETEQQNQQSQNWQKEKFNKSTALHNTKELSTILQKLTQTAFLYSSGALKDLVENGSGPPTALTTLVNWKLLSTEALSPATGLAS